MRNCRKLDCHGKYFAKVNFQVLPWTLMKFYCWNKMGNPTGHYHSTLPAQVANQKTELAASSLLNAKYSLDKICVHKEFGLVRKDPKDR